MSPLAEWQDLLSSATATRRTLDADPASVNYGNEVDAGTFPVGYQKASSTELQRLGRSHGEDLYIMLADLDASGNAPIAKHEGLVLPNEGTLDVASVVEYKQADQRMARLEGLLRS